MQGKISLRTLRRAARDLAVGLTDHDLDVMFVEADVDGEIQHSAVQHGVVLYCTVHT